MDNVTFLKIFVKEYHWWPCANMQVAEQQIADLPCMGVYEADHCRGFMVSIQATSPCHVWHSKPFLVSSLLYGH